MSLASVVRVVEPRPSCGSTFAKAEVPDGAIRE
jgi:hypothetical protein